MKNLKKSLQNLFLVELIKGLMLTGRNFFSKKVTVQFRKKKLLKVLDFAVYMPLEDIRMVRSVA